MVCSRHHGRLAAVAACRDSHLRGVLTTCEYNTAVPTHCQDKVLISVCCIWIIFSIGRESANKLNRANSFTKCVENVFRETILVVVKYLYDVALSIMSRRFSSDCSDPKYRQHDVLRQPIYSE